MCKDQLFLLERSLDGVRSVWILPHNDPDPDAIASAYALRYLLEKKWRIRGEIRYHGIIGRAENKALVQYLGGPLERWERQELEVDRPLALVDTQPGAGNTSLPERSTVAIVFDHHPLRKETANAVFADVRTDMGSTSTILTGYLRAAELEITPLLATALFYGIKTDTMGLVRETNKADIEAYFFLQSRIDMNALVEIERAQVPISYFQQLEAALRSARIFKELVLCYLGPTRRPDMAAEVADFLLRLEGICVVICMGTFRSDLFLAVRSQSRHGGAGDLVQMIVGNLGVAGGHGTMAGGQIRLDGQNAQTVVKELTKRALQYLKLPDDMPGVPLISDRLPL